MADYNPAPAGDQDTAGRSRSGAGARRPLPIPRPPTAPDPPPSAAPRLPSPAFPPPHPMSTSAPIRTSAAVRWTAYTDGACAPSNPGPAAWGAVILGPDGQVVEQARGFIGRGTNQIAEITAAIEGLARTPEGAQVELVSDSQYVLKGLSEWRAGWLRRNWRNSKNEPVANRELWERLFAVADARRVGVRWVRGHAGDTHNERADALANEALRAAAARR